MSIDHITQDQRKYTPLKIAEVAELFSHFLPASGAFLHLTPQMQHVFFLNHQLALFQIAMMTVR